MAVAAPKVQTLESIMGELSPGYDSQRGVIAQQQEAIGARYEAQRMGLDAAKVKGFNDINTQATGKGMTFSGIPVNEQAEYLSYKYLPGVQASQAQQNADVLTLEGQKAALDTDIRNKAFGARENQVGAQNQWNLQQAAQQAAAEAARIDRDFRATQAEKDRAHQAAQAAADRAFQASQNAANRAASRAASSGGGGGGGGAPSLVANIRAYLDNYVNPETGTVPKKVWQNAVQLASESGMKFGGNGGFASTFWGYADDNKWQDYKMGYDKYL